MEASIFESRYWVIPLGDLCLFALAQCFPPESNARATLRFATMPLLVYGIAFIFLITLARNLWDLQIIAFAIWLISLISVALFMASRLQPQESEWRGGLLLFAWMSIIGSPVIVAILWIEMGGLRP